MFLAKKLNKGAGVVSTPDPQFNYVTMLLHGDGTNGAQNNTFLDSSTNAFTITRNGNTTQGSFSPYGPNWSNYFPPGSNRGSTALSPLQFSAVTLTGNFTVESWVYLDSDNTEGNVIVASTLATTNNQFSIDVATYKLFFYDNSAGWTSTNSITLNSWNHVAFVRNSGVVTFYVNGVASGTASTSATISLTTIGALGGYGGGMRGYISNLRVTNTAVYTSSFTPSTTPLTAISGTQLLTCQSNRFIDNSTNSFAITTSGSPSVQRFNPFGASTAYSTSVIGGSGYFDGSGDYLVVGNPIDLDGVNYTVEFWFAGSIFELSWGSAGGYCPIAINSGGAVYFADSSNSTWQANVQNVIIKDGTWNHYAIVRQSGSTKIYRNGVLIGTPAAPSNNSPNGNVTIGLYNSGTQGYVSDLRAVVGTAVYTSAFTPPTAPLTAISGTQLLTNFTNGAIYDNAMMNDLETVGNAQISTSVVKYGTGSIYFDGAGDYLITPSVSSNSFGTGDFTIECWARVISFGSYRTLVCVGDYGNSSGVIMYISAVGQLRIYADGFSEVISSSTISINTWYHFAATRSNGTVRVFIDGTLTGSGTITANITGTQTLVGKGIYTGILDAEGMYGYIDDLRITKGYARYTANFTPPTAAFPNIGPV